MQENMEQKNSEYGHFLRREDLKYFSIGIGKMSLGVKGNTKTYQ